MRPYDSPEEAAFRAEAAEWLESNATHYDRPPVLISSIVSEWSPEEEADQLAVAKDWQRRKFEGGWAGVHWPAKYGGRGGTLMEALIFGQEEAKLDVPWDGLVVGLGWCGLAVMAHASSDLADEVLPPLLRGDAVWCQLFSEPGAGSDLAGLGTRAERDGDEWAITGQKVWTTLAHQADYGLLIARHDPDLPKHRGMTAFLIDMSAEGIETRPMHQMTDSSNFNEVFLDGVRVPDSHRVGEVGAGWSVVVTTFTHERFSPSFANTAILDALRRWVELSGKADDPLVRDRYADIYMRAIGLKYLSMRLLTDISHGRQPGPEGSTMKLAGSLLLADVYQFGLELQGPYGTLLGSDALEEGEWQAGFLGIPGLLIGGGTSDIQRNIIAERVLGLPGDIRVDKDVAFADVPRAR